MTAKELKQLLWEITKIYFARATVQHGSLNGAVKPPTPFIKIGTGNVRRTREAAVTNEDGVHVASYPSCLTVQIDLFTDGDPVDVGPGQTVPADNTAVNDLLEFLKFLDSPFADGWCQERDISIIPLGQVQDLTALIGTTGYEYRAMVELDVHFTQTAAGYTGVMDHPSNDGDDPQITETGSGGGDQDLAKNEGGYFTEAEIKEEKDGEQQSGQDRQGQY